jgi:hypothetical protein
MTRNTPKKAARRISPSLWPRTLSMAARLMRQRSD